MIVAWVLGILTVFGCLQVIAGGIAVARFARAARLTGGGAATPPADARPITVLKPLHGDEPLLAAALTTLCEQDYPAGLQIVCGVGDAADTAVPVVRALQARHPNAIIDLVIDAARHGSNPKVGNLINMLPFARHDVLVIADSDVHSPPDYPRRLAEALARPGVGLVTTLYTGLPAFRAPPTLLGTTQITHSFLPGALLGRMFGRQDCLGATMCLTRDTLARAGGLAALKDHLADDNVLGRRVRALGLDVALAGTVVATTVPERTVRALWRHELRWTRTIRALEPAAFAVSVLQYPLFFAILTVIAAWGALWAWVLFLVTWAARALAVRVIDRALGARKGSRACRVPLWLLPVRDLLSAVEWAAGHAGRRVDWRGEILHADTPARSTAANTSAMGSSKGQPVP